VRVTLAAALLAMACAITASAVSPPQNQPDFQLLPGDCTVYPLCQPGRQAKPWTEAEERMVADALSEIRRSFRGRAAIQSVKRLGITSIRRYDVGADNEGHLQPTQMASFSRRGRFLEVDDRFLSYGPYRDTRSGFSLTAEILLHEMFHVIDDSGMRFSSTEEFKRALGLEERRDHLLWPSDLGAEKIAEHDAAARESARLTSAGEFGRAWDRRRDFAMPLGLPTMRAFARWDEAFAEIGAHMVLDWTASAYLKKSVMDYFGERVFEQLGSLH
jgi:hypothetical protein